MRVQAHWYLALSIQDKNNEHDQHKHCPSAFSTWSLTSHESGRRSRDFLALVTGAVVAYHAAGHRSRHRGLHMAGGLSHDVLGWENWMHSIERSHLLLCNIKRSLLLEIYHFPSN